MADGDYDLALQGVDADIWVDEFHPDFDGDPGPMAAGTINGAGFNEKWLKYQGTWYSRTPNPGGDVGGPPAAPSGTDIKRGKVIIDNTFPAIANCFPAAMVMASATETDRVDQRCGMCYHELVPEY